jgi:hypothetical protein
MTPSISIEKWPLIQRSVGSAGRYCDWRRGLADGSLRLRDVVDLAATSRIFLSCSEDNVMQLPASDADVAVGTEERDDDAGEMVETESPTALERNLLPYVLEALRRAEAAWASLTKRPSKPGDAKRPRRDRQAPGSVGEAIRSGC